MPFISKSEAKSEYFMSYQATNEIYIFSLKYTFSHFTRRNEWHIHDKKRSFIYNFKHEKSLTLNDVIHVRTLRHINNGVA